MAIFAEQQAGFSKKWSRVRDAVTADAPEGPSVRPPLTVGAGATSQVSAPAVERSGASVAHEAPLAGPNGEAADLGDVRDRVVSALLRAGLVTPEQVRVAARQPQESGTAGTLWRQLAVLPGVDREAVFHQAARTYAFREATVGADGLNAAFIRQTFDRLSEEGRDRLFELGVAPLYYERDGHTDGRVRQQRLILGTHDPAHPDVQALVQELHLERTELCYVPEEQVRGALAEAFPRRNKFLDRMNDEAVAVDIGTTFDEEDRLVDRDALEAEINRSVLINLFEATLVEAVRMGASDIHIVPGGERKIDIRFRVDGRLILWHEKDKVHPEALLAVVKDSATGVDRFERDAAQDGFIQRWIDDALIRFRVSVLPIASISQEIRSESVVIRVLDDRKVITDLAELGLQKRALETFQRAIEQPHGMVILTGPTGSGKSTTLVAALHRVVSPEINVLTVEDPVEYIIPGVRQIKLSHKLGLEQALRSILRHDPDVVMVGEMRDQETAELAIKLANTGHLTFSTLHTNDAPSAVSRLYKMGVEPFLIAYAINLIVAQRLIRTLCPVCKVVDAPDPLLLQRLGFSDDEIASTTFYQQGADKRCSRCGGTGYKGRRAISETLHFSRAVRQIIVEADKAIDEDAIRDKAIEEGMLTLADSAREVVKVGGTSVADMMRVIFTE